MAVASPTVIAFANSFMARHPLNHARWFSRGSCHEADTSSLALRPARLLALTNKVRLLSSFRRNGSPHPNVDYDYAGKQPIPATGLAPARHTSVWAARGTQESRREET